MADGSTTQRLRNLNEYWMYSPGVVMMFVGLFTCIYPLRIESKAPVISKKAGSIQGLIGADSLIPCSHGLAGSDTALHGMAYTYL